MLTQKSHGYQPQNIRQAQMPRLLNILGYEDNYTTWRNAQYGHRSPFSGQVPGSWWTRNEEKLDWILTDIHESYSQQAKRIRTDLVPNHTRAVELNLAWGKVRKLFAQRGLTYEGGREVSVRRMWKSIRQYHRKTAARRAMPQGEAR